MDNSIKDLPNFCKFENSDFTRFMIVSKTAQDIAKLFCDLKNHCSDLFILNLIETLLRENVTTNCSITRRICLKK